MPGTPVGVGVLDGVLVGLLVGVLVAEGVMERVKVEEKVKVGLNVLGAVGVSVAKGLGGERTKFFWHAVTRPMLINNKIESKRRGFIRVPKSFWVQIKLQLRRTKTILPLLF